MGNKHISFFLSINLINFAAGIMNSEKGSHRLIAKNSVFLVTRSVVGLVIGLYTARVLLAKLGIDDYGVYHVVGSVVIMFNSVRSLFANAIQRFLNYSKGDTNRQNEIFNAGIRVQLLLSVAFVLLAETIGLYAFLHLNLSEEQFAAARMVYQLSVATAVVSMMTIPYDALIIAKERMDVYAWLSVFGMLLHLGIVFLISVGPFSRLVNYAVLVFLVSLLLRLISAGYCKRYFKESKVRRFHNQALVGEMARFAGWNFLGYTGLYVSHQGIDYILNLSGGVVVNAARSIAYKVMRCANMLVSNADMAFKPQTNAAAANPDKSEFYRLLGYNAKTAFVCYLLIVVPLLIFARQAVGLWLGQVPEYVVVFLFAISPYYLLRSVHELVNQFFISIGEMKGYQIIEIGTMALIVPVAWLLLRDGYPFWTAFMCMAVFELLNHACTVWFACKRHGFPLRYFIQDVYLPFAGMAAIAFCMVYGGKTLGLGEVESLLHVAGWCVVIELVMAALVAVIVLKRQERELLCGLMAKKLWKQKV